MATDFHVMRGDLRTHRFVPAADVSEVEIAAGEVVLGVDAFAFTANNVTYGAMGDALDYWRFFPAPDGWGRIPAWGFATVVRSELAGIAEGTRYYGYVPMSTHVTMRPGGVRRSTFSDAEPHRAALHPLYNQYTLTPPADDLADALQLLLRPLFITSFILDEYLAEQAAFGARRVVVSSASSKTAYGTAFLMAARAHASGHAVEIVGLTSPAHVAFVRGLGFYDRVVAYDALETLPTDEAAIYVDFAANDGVRHAVHARLGEALRFSSAIGFTHWDAGARVERTPLAGPAPVPFFAPSQIAKFIDTWGATGFNARFDDAWQRFTRAVRAGGATFLHVRHGSGPDDVARVYDAALAGTLRPDEGHVLRLP